MFAATLFSSLGETVSWTAEEDCFLTGGVGFQTQPGVLSRDKDLTWALWAAGSDGAVTNKFRFFLSTLFQNSQGFHFEIPNGTILYLAPSLTGGVSVYQLYFLS